MRRSSLTRQHQPAVRSMFLGPIVYLWLVVTVVVVKASRPTTTSCCTTEGLTGIVQGGGAGVLDLDKVTASLGGLSADEGTAPIFANADCSSGLETPIAMRTLLVMDAAAFTVAALFDRNQAALDVFGDKRTSNARRRCQPTTPEETTLFDLHRNVALAYALAYGGLSGMPYCQEPLSAAMNATDIPLSLVQEGEADVNTPWGLARAYVDEINAYMTEYDGWNADGSLSRKFNRIPFSDYAVTDFAGNSWTPYVPRNSPYNFKHKNSWQPLMESDGLGYIVTQEHVTPHIGVTGRFFGFNSPQDEREFASRELADPSYDYPNVVHDVLEETRLTATETLKQEAIAFFDNKWTSLVTLKAVFFGRFNESALDFNRATFEVQLATYNGVIMSWREKIRHDLPRPPTVITDQLGDSLVKSYAGPDQGVQTLKASEWEPFIRTMPHSEFPSTSACLCQVYAEQVALFLEDDVIDPPLVFNNFSFKAWSDISTVCGNSRVWGGMHFAAAVPAGAELCGGGRMARSINRKVGRLLAGDERAAIFDRKLRKVTVRPL